jgi:uncharacterized protein (TIGR03083 family)
MEYANLLDAVSEHSGALLTRAERAPLATPVPSCPQWAVRDLLGHAGSVWGWAANLVRGGDRHDRPAPPEETAAVAGWARSMRRELLDALAEVEPGRACWVFRGSTPQAVGFWGRRMAHESAIHRLDVELAAGNEPEPLFDREFAADGIDELLTNLLPAFARRREPITDQGTVLVHAADAGAAWLVRLRPGEPLTVEQIDGAATEADAGVRGVADAVYRAVWGRPSTAVRSGDEQLLRRIAAP